MKKPIEKTRMVEQTYYDCGISDHDHLSYSSANNCLMRQRGGIKRKDRLKKQREVLMFLCTGGTYAQAVRDLGVKNEWARNVFFKMTSMHHGLTDDEMYPAYKDRESLLYLAKIWGGREWEVKKLEVAEKYRRIREAYRVERERRYSHPSN